MRKIVEINGSWVVFIIDDYNSEVLAVSKPCLTRQLAIQRATHIATYGAKGDIRFEDGASVADDERDTLYALFGREFESDIDAELARLEFIFGPEFAAGVKSRLSEKVNRRMSGER